MGAEIIPRGLRKGDTVAFISPSARAEEFFPEPLKRAQAYFEHLGYHVKCIFNSSKPKVFRDMVLQRCEEIHSAFRDPEVKAIICTAGGSCANELLSYLDYDLIRSNPKIFCGYSDITVLHYAFFTQAGLRTFYGPSAATEFGLAPEPYAFTMESFWHVLHESAGKEIGPLPRSLQWGEKRFDFGKREVSKPAQENSSSTGWTWLRAGQGTGRIVGGCLTVILRLAGTKYWPDYHGSILLLENPPGEDIHGPMPVDETRARMADLANLGVFDMISGLVIGRPIGYNEKMLAELQRLVEDQSFGTKFPILMNVDIGHTEPMLTIPLNAMASLDSEKDEFRILEAGVIAST